MGLPDVAEGCLGQLNSSRSTNRCSSPFFGDVLTDCNQRYAGGAAIFHIGYRVHLTRRSHADEERCLRCHHRKGNSSKDNPPVTCGEAPAGNKSGRHGAWNPHSKRPDTSWLAIRLAYSGAMGTVWITFATENNVDGDVDYLAQEIGRCGLRTRMHPMFPGEDEKIDRPDTRFLSRPEQSDAWILYASSEGLPEGRPKG